MQFILGTLTRYYADGGPALEPLEVRDPEVIAGAVSAWRHWLNKELPHALDWDESPTAPFENVAIGDRGVGALYLAATRTEEETLPQKVPADWREHLDEFESERRFAQIVLPELWLPGEHDFLFKARSLSEDFIWIGSSEELLRDLETLEHHWQSELEIRESFAGHFRKAREVLQRLARRSVDFRLPLHVNRSI